MRHEKSDRPCKGRTTLRLEVPRATGVTGHCRHVDSNRPVLPKRANSPLQRTTTLHPRYFQENADPNSTEARTARSRSSPCSSSSTPTRGLHPDPSRRKVRGGSSTPLQLGREE